MIFTPLIVKNDPGPPVTDVSRFAPFVLAKSAERLRPPIGPALVTEPLVVVLLSWASSSLRTCSRLPTSDDEPIESGASVLANVTESVAALYVALKSGSTPGLTEVPVTAAVMFARIVSSDCESTL